MDTLIAGLVIDSKRMDMMPKYFGRWMMKTEGNIYGWMKEICASYSGGYWDMWEVSNGAFFMVPPLKKEGYTLSINGNGFEGGVDCPRYRCCGLSFCILLHVGNDRR